MSNRQSQGHRYESSGPVQAGRNRKGPGTASRGGWSVGPSAGDRCRLRRNLGRPGRTGGRHGWPQPVDDAQVGLTYPVYQPTHSSVSP